MSPIAPARLGRLRSFALAIAGAAALATAAVVPASAGEWPPLQPPAQAAPSISGDCGELVMQAPGACDATVTPWSVAPSVPAPAPKGPLPLPVGL